MHVTAWIATFAAAALLAVGGFTLRLLRRRSENPHAQTR
jgi:hypothetical protein